MLLLLLLLQGTGCLVTMQDQFMTHLGVVAGVSAAFAIILVGTSM